jgi:hypothetical protein
MENEKITVNIVETITVYSLRTWYSQKKELFNRTTWIFKIVSVVVYDLLPRNETKRNEKKNQGPRNETKRKNLRNETKWKKITGFEKKRNEIEKIQTRNKNKNQGPRNDTKRKNLWMKRKKKRFSKPGIFFHVTTWNWFRSCSASSCSGFTYNNNIQQCLKIGTCINFESNICAPKSNRSKIKKRNTSIGFQKR